MTPTPITLTNAELRAILAARYPFAFGLVLDSDYNIPTDASFSTFCDELAAELLAKYGDRWRDFFDCDNFALEALVLACRKHWIARYQNNHGNAQGVAIGVLGYLTRPDDGTSGHCIALRVDDQRQVREFEPQNRQPLPLTPEQCASAFFYLVS
jgi:hypothetical protein